MIKRMELAFLWFLAAPILLIATVLMLHTRNKLPETVFENLPPIVSSLDTNSHTSSQVLGVQIADMRPLIVEKFLNNTPLEPYAANIVETSDKYQIDYRFIPAIAMKESQAGKAAREGSYNAWGFENGRTNFGSWEEAIDTVGKTIKTRYVDRGLTTPDTIMPVYAPPQVATGGKWAKDVNYFFTKLSSFD